MNELLFFIQILLIVGFAKMALKLGESALIAWVSIQALIANLFVMKQITLFSFDVTASDGFAIGSLLGLNFLQEYFGKEKAKQATWICFFFMLFFTLCSLLHLAFIPNGDDYTHASFVTILSQSPRLLFASMAVFFVVQQIDIRVFSFLKSNFSHKSFALRSGLSLILSQFLDTTLFSIVGLYGIVTSIVSIIIFSFLIKLLVIFFFSCTLKWVKA